MTETEFFTVVVTITAPNAPTAALTSLSPSTLAPGATSTVTVTLTNPNSGSSLSGVADSIALPSGVVIANVPGFGTTCTGGTGTATAGGGTVSLSGATLAASATCTFSFNVRPSSAGTFTIPSGTPSATGANPGVPGPMSDLTVTPPVPTVSRISPTSGKAGDTVTITGTNFVSGDTYSADFDGTVVTATVASATTLTATAPAHAPGDVTVTVTDTTASTAATGSATFTYLSPPTVTLRLVPNAITTGGISTAVWTILNPNTGTALTGLTLGGITLPGNVTVSSLSTDCGAGVDFSAGALTMSGPNLAATRSCEIGMSISSASAGVFSIPAGVPGTVGGLMGVVGTAQDLTVNSPAPTVSDIDPNAGKAGDTVTIEGKDFVVGQTYSVDFGGATATATSDSATTLTATVPAHAPGIVIVTITDANGVTLFESNDAPAAGVRFTYLATPTLSVVFPNVGAATGGATVVITGANLTGATAVTFGTTPATTFTANSNTQITAIAPAHAAGDVNLAVTTPGGTATLTNGYRFVSTPTITGINPATGPPAGGTNVTITGSGFTGASTVTFGNSGATSVTVVSDTQIAAGSPAGTGTVDVRVTTPGGTSATSAADQFTYVTAPIVTASPFSPNVQQGSTAILRASAKGATSVKWQVSTAPNSGSFTDISDDANYSGTTTLTGNNAALTITAHTPLSGLQYRAVFSNAGGSTETDAGTLSVQFNIPNASASLSASSMAKGGQVFFELRVTNTNDVDVYANIGLGLTPGTTPYALPAGMSVTNIHALYCQDADITFHVGTADPGLISVPSLPPGNSCIVALTLTSTTGGTATFDNVTFETGVVGGGLSSTNLGVVNSPFEITTGPAARFVIDLQGTPRVGGGPVNIIVTAVDADGDTAAGYAGTVRLASSDSSAILPGDFTLTNGVGTVPITFGRAGSFSVTATDVGTPSLTWSRDEIRVADADLTVSGIAPTGGKPGNEVTISGTNFVSGHSYSADFDGAAAVATYSSATTLTATVPDHAPGVVTVTVRDAANLSMTSSGVDDVSFTYLSPPTLTAAFNAPSIGIYNETNRVLTLTLTNPSAGGPDMTGIGFVVTLPSGLVLAEVPVSDCGGSADGIIEQSTITVSGVSRAAGANCTITAQVLATTLGVKTVSITAPTATNAPNGAVPATASLTAIKQPIVTLNLSPSTIAPGGSTTATWTLSNPNSDVGFTALGLALVGNPDPDFVSFTGSPTTTCPGGATTLTGATAGDFFIMRNTATLPANGTCTVTATLMSSRIDGHSISGGLAVAAGGLRGFGEAKTLQVAATAPTLTSSPSNATVTVGSTTTVTATATGATSVKWQGTTVSDNTFQDLSDDVNFSGTTTLTGDQAALTITGRMALRETRYRAVFNNGASVTRSQAGVLTVTPAAPVVSASLSPSRIAKGGTATLTLSISNPNDLNAGGAFARSVSPFTLPYQLPSGVTATGPGTIDCEASGSTFAAGSPSGLVGLSAVPIHGQCNVTVPVTSSTVGTVTFADFAYELFIFGASQEGTIAVAGGSLTVMAGATTHFKVEAAGTPRHGRGRVDVTVTALDADNDTDVDYAGTVQLTSTDGLAAEPGRFTLVNGVATVRFDLSAVGTHTITATDTVTASITGTTAAIEVVKASQVLTFNSAAPTAAKVGDAPYVVRASSGSGMPVAFTINPSSNGVCSLQSDAIATVTASAAAPSSATVSLIGGGTCTINADQAGDENYNAATRAQQTFQIASAVPTITSVSPASGFVSGGTSVTLTGTDLSGATLTVGGAAVTPSTITATGLTFTTPSHAAGAVDVVVTTVGGTATATYTYVAPTLTMSPATLADGTVGTPYSQAVTVAGGTAPYTYFFGPGSLPRGMSLATDGTLSGTPTSVGDHPFTITVTDTSVPGPYFVERQFILRIAQATSSVSLVSSLNPSTPGANVTFTATVTGSSPTGQVTFRDNTTVLGSVPLTSGAAAYSTTALSVGTHNITATYSGDTINGGSTSSGLSQVVGQAPALTPGTLPAATFGAAYSQAITATGGEGGFTFAVTAGTLPAGISLATSGALTGNPTAVGTFAFTVTAKDRTGISTPGLGYSITVNPAVPGAPTIGTATAGSAQATVSFTAPTSNGGAAITAYTVISSAGPTATGTASPILVIGLTNGLSQTFTVVATNSAGPGLPSAASNAVSPLAKPVAGAVTVAVPYDSAAQIVTLALSGGTTASVAVTTQAGHGVATASGTAITYAPTAGYSGVDSFAYTATNASGTSEPASVTITVGLPAAPTVAAASANVAYNAPGQAIPLTATGVYTTLSVGTAPTHGTATITGTTATYVPTTGYFGTDSFTYTATGPGGVSTPATVTLTVATPAAPTVAAASANVAYNAPGQTIPLTATGVYTTLAIGTAPTHGTATITGTTATYVPTSGYFGTDSFTYTATGPGGVSTPATVTLTVATPAAPTVAAASANVAYNAPGQAIPLTATGVYTTLSVGTAPTHGTVTITGTTATYVPTSGYFGTDSFTYTATGPGGVSTPATVTLTVATPPPPVVTPPPPTTTPPPAGEVPGTTTVDLTPTTSGPVTSYEIIVQAKHGSASIETVDLGLPTMLQLGGARIYRLRYTPAPGFMGVDTVSVVAMGPGGASSPAVFTFNVSGKAANLWAQVVSNTSVTLRPTESVTGGPFRAIRITRQPAFGTAVVQGLAIVFTPGVSNGGTTSLEYVVDLAFGTSAAGRIDLTSNLAPTAQALTARTPAGRPVTVRITDGAQGGPFTGAAVAGITPAGSATAVLVQSGTAAAPIWDLTFTPQGTFNGQAVVSFTLTNAFATVPGTLTVTVDPRPDPSLDPDVRGVISSQVSSARRFADAQSDNFNRRLEQIRQGDNGDSNTLNLNLGFAAGRSQLDPQARLRQQLGGDRQPFGDEALRSRLGLLDEAEERRLNRSDRSADPFAAPATTGTATPGLNRAMGQDDDIKASNIGVWAAGGIDWGHRDASTGARDYRFATSGISAGSDIKLSDRLVVGVGAGYGLDHTRIGSVGSQSDGRSVVVAAYGGWKAGSSLSVNGVIGYGDLDFESRRWATAANAGQGGWAYGQRGGDMVFGSLSLASDDDLGWMRRSYYARLEAQSVTLDAFTERDADIYALRYDALDFNSLSTTLGLKYDWRIERRQGVLSPSVRLEWTHAFDHAGSQTTAYADWLASPRYSVGLDSWDRDTIEFGLDGGWKIGDQLDLSVGYRAAIGTTTVSQGLQLKLMTRF